MASVKCAWRGILLKTRTWRTLFENYLVASELKKKQQAAQCAQLLHYIGEEGFRILNNTEEGKNNLSKLVQKFKEHFLLKTKCL